MQISSTSIWGNALNNLLHAQSSQSDAANQYSTQKVATDLKGFGRTSEILTTYQSNLTQANGYIDIAKSVSDRLNSQDLALQTTYDAAQSARQNILNAIASSNGGALTQAIGLDFASALQGLNSKYQGNYLFSGGNDTQAPVKANVLSDLSALASGAAAFTNGTIKKTSQIDTNTTVQTGQNASDFGTKLVQAFKDFQDYVAANPLSGQLTEAQKTQLTTLANAFNTASQDVTGAQALNGTLQKRVTNAQALLQSQADNFTTMIGDKTDVDLATAYARLSAAQQALQASSQVIAQLKTDTLLNILQ